VIPIAQASDLPEPGEGTYVLVDGTDLAIFNVDGEYFVTANTCPHQGAPLGDGWLHGKVVSCPLHAWEFDVTTGEMPGNPQIRVKTYPCKLVEGALHAEM
jgi:nitrite reductase/ring-hydroxylating ferredoxin subunit